MRRAQTENLVRDTNKVSRRRTDHPHRPNLTAVGPEGKDRSTWVEASISKGDAANKRHVDRDARGDRYQRWQRPKVFR